MPKFLIIPVAKCTHYYLTYKIPAIYKPITN